MTALTQTEPQKEVMHKYKFYLYLSMPLRKESLSPNGQNDQRFRNQVFSTYLSVFAQIYVE